MKSSFFIVADRGNLKAFRAERVAADRPLRLNLVQSFSFLDGHAKLSDVLTDSAGRFPTANMGGNGHFGSNGAHHQNSVAEKHYELENDRRSAKQLGEMISKILREEHATAWSLAIPSDMKEAVLGEMDQDLRKNLAEYVPRDLVKVAASDLLSHFNEVRAA